MNYSMFAVIFFIGLSGAQTKKFTYAGSWLELKIERRGIFQFLIEMGIPKKEAEAYEDGPITMQCIELTEEGFEINGIQPDGVPYNASISWEKGPRRPYMAFGMRLEFDSEVKNNTLFFFAYKKRERKSLFTVVHQLDQVGDMEYTFKVTKSGTVASTFFRKREADW